MKTGVQFSPCQEGSTAEVSRGNMIEIRGKKMDSNQLLNSKLLENCSVCAYVFFACKWPNRKRGDAKLAEVWQVLKEVTLTSL